jgi:SM-20-related protein
MLNAEFFRDFGMYFVRGFFDADLCAKLRAEVRSAVAAPTTVRIKGSEYGVNETIRRTQWADVSSSTLSFVEARLTVLKPALERHFETQTTGYRTPQFLVYKEGDFFAPHADRSSDPDAPVMATGRRVSVVLFLNSEADEPAPDTYGGGSLTFYGLLDDPRIKDYGFPLKGEEGLLVAFRPEVVHAVSPVTHGERYTIVTWLED